LLRRSPVLDFRSGPFLIAGVIFVTLAKEGLSSLFPGEQRGRHRSVIVWVTEAMMHRGQEQEM